MKKQLSGIWQGAVSLLYPQSARCLGCGLPFGGAQEDWLCPACKEGVAPLPSPRCPRCARPLKGRGCPHCARWPAGLLLGVHAPYLYAPPLNAAIRAFKYQGMHAMHGQLAEEMVLCWQREGHGFVPDVAVPVPIDKKSLKERGYNQAALLSGHIAAHLGILHGQPLSRVRKTRRQATLSQKERMRNLKGVMRCERDMTGMRVLLVDDVLTTGATGLECARALREAGAAGVHLLVLAVVPPGTSEEANF